MKSFFTLIFSIVLIIFSTLCYSQTTYTWTNSSSGGAWNNSANWVPNTGFPGTGDNAVINPIAPITITNVPAISIASITIGGAGLTDSVILSSSSADTLTINGNVTVNGGGLFIGANLTLNFISCSSYNHNMDAGTIPTATWGANSNCNIIGVIATAPANLSQNFYNFLWNCTAQTGIPGFQNNFPTGINGTCEFRSSGTTQLNWDFLPAGGTKTWAGDLVVSGAHILVLTNATTSSVNFNLRDVIITDAYGSGKLRLNNTTDAHVPVLTFNIRNLNINAGVLDFLGIYEDNATFNMTGDLTLATAGSIISANALGTVAGTYAINFKGTTQQNINIASGCFISGNYNAGGYPTRYLSFTATSGSIVNFATPFQCGTGSYYVNFTAASGSTLMIQDVNGITTGNGQTTGSVRLPGANTGGSDIATFSTGASYTYNGSTAQITGTALPATVNNFTINNASGVTSTNGVTVNGTLNLTSGILSLGNNNLTLPSTGILAGTPSVSNMIVTNGTGKFFRGVPSGFVSLLFPIGDATPYYSPVTLDFTSNTNAGSVGARVTNSTEVNNNTPTAPSSYLSRYWTFSNTGLTNYSYTGTFCYPAINISGTESAIKLSEWTGSAWFEDDTGSSALSGTMTITEALNQTTAPLTVDFTGRVQSSSSCTAPVLNAMANGTATSITICSGGAAASVALTANPATGTGCTGTFEYAWFNGIYYWNGTGFTSPAAVYSSAYNSISYSTSASTVYTVSGRCSNNTSCISSSSVSVNLPASVTPSVTIYTEFPVINSDTSVTFTATPVNGGNSPFYQWQKNGVNVGSNSNTYTDSSLNNNDVITCILTSNAGCPTNVTATSNAITMTVFEKVTPTVTISASQTAVCPGTIVTFTAMPDDGGTLPIYQWRKNGIDVGTTSATYKDSSLNNNDVIYCVLTSNAACLLTNTATSNSITITTADSVIPTIVISTSTDIVCAGTTVTFDASITNGGVSPTYQWKINGTATGTNSPEFSGSGLHNHDAVTCLLTSSASCAIGTAIISDTITMTVNPGASAGIVTAQTDTVCSGNEVSLSVTGSSGNVQWQLSPTGASFTDINNADDTAYSTTPLQTTFFRVYTTAGSCNDTSAAVQIVVDTLPPLPTLTTNDTLICSGDSSQVCASTGYTTYLWNNGANTNCTYATSAGGYWITATGANGCSVVSSHLNISVYPVPSVSIIVRGDTLSSYDESGYQWYNNNVLINGATLSFYVASQAGIYSVQVTDSNGCKAISNQVTVTGINDLNEDNIAVYPNPSFNGNWQLAVDDNLVGSKLEIYDDNGRLVLQSEIRNSQSGISLNAGPGVYLLRIYTSGANITRRLVRL